MDLTGELRRQARWYRCAVCGENMAECDIRVLEQREHVALVRVTCASCQEESHFQIMYRSAARDAGPSRAQIEGASTAFDEPVGSDEMLDARLALAEHRGDLRSLLES